MVKITDGVHTMEVSMGAYKGIFSKQGYTLVDEGNGPEVAPEVAPEAGGHEPESSDGDKAFLTELKEKPLSQWSKGEVKRFAAMFKLDITGTKNIGEAKAIIKAYMDEHSTDDED